MEESGEMRQTELNGAEKAVFGPRNYDVCIILEAKLALNIDNLACFGCKRGSSSVMGACGRPLYSDKQT